MLPASYRLECSALQIEGEGCVRPLHRADPCLLDLVIVQLLFDKVAKRDHASPGILHQFLVLQFEVVLAQPVPDCAAPAYDPTPIKGRDFQYMLAMPPKRSNPSLLF